MRLRFSKMHGLGNDFVVIDATRCPLVLTPAQIRQLADRHFGIGCDQLLLVEPPRDRQTDFYYRIFNADGGEVEQCGNGARCFARFVRDRGLTDKKVIDVGTTKGSIRLYIETDGQVRVNMGRPRFDPASLPFIAPEEALDYELSVAEATVRVAALSMGNPHAVLQVEDPDLAPVAQLGTAIQIHAAFPQGVNFGFMGVENRQHIHLRVFERGVGETLACGTGACAAAIAGIRWGLLDAEVQVSLPGGDLMISWRGDAEPVWMTGPAARVFDGEIGL